MGGQRERLKPHIVIPSLREEIFKELAELALSRIQEGREFPTDEEVDELVRRKLERTNG